MHRHANGEPAKSPAALPTGPGVPCDKDTYIALDVVFDDIAKERHVHVGAFKTLCDWLADNRSRYFPAVQLDQPDTHRRCSGA